ncbi:hypothetical protein D9M69_576770 [compost metagenome]
MPQLAYCTLPGDFLASAMSSLALFAGKSLVAISRIEAVPTCPMGAKSLTESYESLGLLAGSSTCVVAPPSPIV